MNQPVAGWYRDPAGGGGLRWWDGRRWTDAVREAGAGSGGGLGGRWRLLVWVVVGVVAVGVMVAVVAGGSSGLPDERVAEFEAAVNGRDAEALSQVLVVDADEVDVVVQGMLPAGTELRVDAGSFELVDEGVATVEGYLEGAWPGRVVLFLVEGDDGQWWMVGSSVPQDVP